MVIGGVSIGALIEYVLLQKAMIMMAVPMPIFAQSFVVSIAVGISAAVVYPRCLRGLSGITLFFIGATYISFFNLFSVYTTVFVDRSLTYHMIFYSVYTGQITQSDIKTLFSSETYQAQRIQDMTDSGFLVASCRDANVLMPTQKAKLFTRILVIYSDFLGLGNRYREATQVLTGWAPHGK
jgi:hypothetical protein